MLLQITNENRRSWNVENDADGDLDVFFSQIVLPLRQLADDGVIDELFESEFFQHGRRAVGRVVIRGAVKT